MALTIAGLSFKNQTLAKEHVRKILKKYPIGSKVTDVEDEGFLLELVKRHPNHTDKLNGFKSFITKENLAKKRDLWVLTNSGIKDVSWVRCISKKPDKPTNYLTEAMRNAVIEQVLSWKNKNHSADTTCEICSINLPTTLEAHADHDGRFFRDISKDFLEATDVKVPESFDDDKYNRAVFKKEDSLFEKNWRLFHFINAKYRFLCASCNSRHQ